MYLQKFKEKKKISNHIISQAALKATQKPSNAVTAMRLIMPFSRHLIVDGCQSNLCVMLKQLLFFYKLNDYFCRRRHSLMNRPCYNNVFQFTQHCNFGNLNKVIFTH